MEKEVIGILQKIGDMLSPYAKESWELIVKQQTISGIVTIGVFVFLYIFCSVLILFAKKVYISEKSEYHKRYPQYKFDMDDSGQAFGCISIVFFSCLVVFITSLIYVPEAFMKIFNPEYYAIQFLLDSLPK